jgi:dTDP-4-dehydrorhamnose reductase
MRILVLGASGLVGAAVAATARRRGHAVRAWGGGGPDARPPGCDRAVDLRSEATLAPLLAAEEPEAIVNAAAISHPAGVESDREGSWRLNVDLPGQLAAFARRAGIPLLQFSSDMVFPGGERNYRPGDAPAPPHLYGEQKQAAEQRVAELHPSGALVLRITLVNGNSPRGRRSVHEKLLAAIAAGERPRLFRDEIRQPSGVRRVAEVVGRLLEVRAPSGLYHWGGAETLSRHDLGCRILAHFGLAADLVEAGELPPGRPGRLVLDDEGLGRRLGLGATTVEEQVADLRFPAGLRLR